MDENTNKNMSKSGKRAIARRKRKIQMITRLVALGIIVLIVIIIVIVINKNNKDDSMQTSDTIDETTQNTTQKNNAISGKENNIEENSIANELDGSTQEGNTIVEPGSNEEEQDLGWELMLANGENQIPKDYEIELKSIDKYREIDSRVYKYYMNMLNDMKEDKIENIWAQSAYRSVKSQGELFNNKVEYYINLGKTKEKAEELTEESIMRPGCSDHNLGLAIDFNYVNEDFEDLKGFKWLKENAEDYGFVLRYPKEKEEITKVKYEPWHWRYVGIENAKEMNKKDMCLEEYVEYLKNK